MHAAPLYGEFDRIAECWVWLITSSLVRVPAQSDEALALLITSPQSRGAIASHIREHRFAIDAANEHILYEIEMAFGGHESVMPMLRIYLFLSWIAHRFKADQEDVALGHACVALTDAALASDYTMLIMCTMLLRTIQDIINSIRTQREGDLLLLLQFICSIELARRVGTTAESSCLNLSKGMMRTFGDKVDLMSALDMVTVRPYLIHALEEAQRAASECERVAVQLVSVAGSHTT